jgi:hypothetical protein
VEEEFKEGNPRLAYRMVQKIQCGSVKQNRWKEHFKKM